MFRACHAPIFLFCSDTLSRNLGRILCFCCCICVGGSRGQGCRCFRLLKCPQVKYPTSPTRQLSMSKNRRIATLASAAAFSAAALISASALAFWNAQLWSQLFKSRQLSRSNILEECYLQVSRTLLCSSLGPSCFGLLTQLSSKLSYLENQITALLILNANTENQIVHTSFKCTQLNHLTLIIHSPQTYYTLIWRRGSTWTTIAELLEYSLKQLTVANDKRVLTQ